MPRRWVHILLLIGLLGLVIVPDLAPARAQNGGTTGRKGTVEVSGKEYVWHLVAPSGNVVCQVTNADVNPPNPQETIEQCAASITAFYSAATPAPGTPAVQVTATPFNLNQFVRSAVWRLAETREVKRSVEVQLPDLVVYISAPPGIVRQPYVILTAYEPVREYEITAIDGTIGTRSFHCDGARCEVPFTVDTNITFWATSSQGSQSEPMTAEVRALVASGGYQVVLSGVSYLSLFEDACAAQWGLPGETVPLWARFPQSPLELQTAKTLHLLAAELLSVGLADASDCPGQGFISPGVPNACGIERATEAMVQWQNQFDPIIWSTGLDTGIPPRLIKALIEQESQFWPGNSLYYMEEFGLAQMNQLGADVVLRYDRTLYQQVCNELMLNCTPLYTALPSSMQAMLRGGLMRYIDAECPSCSHGVDLFAAEQSIPIIARMLYSHCQQTRLLVQSQNLSAAYDTLWRFTMTAYHAGYSCLANAVAEAKADGVIVDWPNVASRLRCRGAAEYVNNLWLKLDQQFAAQPAAPAPEPTLVPTFSPLATPIPTTPAPPVTVQVLVYLDANNNQVVDPGEEVDGLEVVVRYSSGETQRQTTSDGQAVFQTFGELVGSRVTVQLPTLFRETTTTIPANREISVTFRLEQPPLPTALP